MKFFAAKNLRSTEVAPCDPYSFGEENLARVPKQAFKDKGIRTTWASNPQTDWQMFTGHEGKNPNMRIGKSNPIHSTSVVIADYDVALEQGEIDSGLRRCDKVKPNMLETTFSGNLRAVWTLEKEIIWPTPEFFEFAIKHIGEIIPVHNFVGLDEGALYEPSRLFTNGCKWRKIHDAPIPHSLVMGWLQQMVKKFQWSPPNEAKIPLDIVAAELAKLYPKFAEWPGEFVEESRGPTFWEPDSTSPVSAWVLPGGSGLYSMAAHAEHKPRVTWSDLLGAEFVKKYHTSQMGKALDSVYYDGRHFIHKQMEGLWQYDTIEEFGRYLRTEHSISDRRPKGSMYSPLDEAVQHVKNTSLISSAGSFAFYPKGIFMHQGKKMLNVHTVDVLQPAPAGDSPKVWGDGFPWLASYFKELLTTQEQLDILLAHLAHNYRGNYKRCPNQGQACVLVGIANRGKTFFAREVAGGLMNGFAEAEDYFLGNDNFNSELFEVGIWVVDDGKMSVSAHRHQEYTEGVKRAVANPAHRSNEKFRRAGMVKWSGRVYIQCNADAESMRAAPGLDQSTADKVNMFLFTEVRTDGFVFPPKAEIEVILARELPHFARWLLDYEIPAHCLSGDNRFYIRTYQEPSLVREVTQNSKAATCGELIDMFLTDYFRREPDKDCWEGTVSGLHAEIAADPSRTEQLRAWPVPAMARALTTLSTQKGWDIHPENTTHRRLFVICRGDRFPKLPISPTPKQTKNSKFEKTNEPS